ncbi:ABC transporter permease [Flavobacterium sp. 3HN19-14]|uniref:ABC transporter permease n=1 Tax=Flavobacterium sp. 3HN19-14 TaxID=3448133 RepID=UPI003EE408ED
MRNGVLIAQFAIASFFIVGSYIVYEQIDYLNNKDLGFKGKQVLQVDYRNPYDFRDETMPKKLLNRYNFIHEQLLYIKGVEKAAAGAFSIGTGNGASTTIGYKGIEIQIRNMAIDFDMIDMMKIKVIKGRNLSDKFASDTIGSILINETTAKLMKEKDPIGKEFRWNDKQLKIVGIVKDFHLQGQIKKFPP